MEKIVWFRIGCSIPFTETEIQEMEDDESVVAEKIREKFKKNEYRLDGDTYAVDDLGNIIFECDL